jgi:lipopolysaccharide/colanic/teichoic acid biosynthesis glycosyltransferase
MDSIRFFDISIALCIKLTSKGAVIFSQIRVGKYNIDFKLYKFRTMYQQAESKGQLTVGGRDNRITGIGYYLRKFKLDELPQLFNVLNGKMSLVGPRPEVRKYVNLYTNEQLKVLNVLPGITDYASLAFRNENDLLANAENPEQYYIDEIMPKKIELNKKFIENRTIKNYFLILIKTVKTAVKGE